MRSNKGFTLIEMLVVIAVVAVLVTVILPVVESSSARARAAADAANLRIVLGMANSVNFSTDLGNALSSVRRENVKSATFKDAKMYIAYSYPAFIDIMFVEGAPNVQGSKYYDIEYFADISKNGSTTRVPGMPTPPDGLELTWYNVTDSVND